MFINKAIHELMQIILVRQRTAFASESLASAIHYIIYIFRAIEHQHTTHKRFDLILLFKQPLSIYEYMKLDSH